MKVCHITTVHPLWDTRIFHKECKSLVKEGYDVSLIIQHEKSETIDGVNVIALAAAKNRFHRMLILTSKALVLAVKQRADIYHFHDPELLPVGAVLKLLGKKVIYDAHENVSKSLMSRYYLPVLLRNIVAGIVGLLEKTLALFFDAVVCATEDIQKSFCSQKAICVSNFPILNNFNNLVSRSDNSHNQDDSFNLIYVGALSPERGISKIIQAMEHISSNKTISLSLYGTFSPNIYENEVRHLKGFEKVSYTGWIEPGKVPDVLQKHDAGIVCFLPEPNHINSMPNKLFEYMAAGLPVIASNFPLWKEIVECSSCGICVDSSNPKEIAKAIEYMLEHPIERKEMGNMGKQGVSERFNWEIEVSKLLGLYKTLLNR